MVEEPELTVGEVGGPVAEERLAPGKVEPQPADLDHVPVAGRRLPAELDADSRDQLVEREGLRQVVVRPQLEAAQLRGQVGARREDHDRQVGAPPPELREHGEAVDPG